MQRRCTKRHPVAYIDPSVTTPQVRTNEVDGELSQLLEEWGGSGIRSRLTVPQCVAHNDPAREHPDRWQDITPSSIG